MPRRARNLKEWSSIIEKWKLSGLTVNQFCRQENICESRFYEIRKQIQTGINKRSKYSKPLFLPVQIRPEQKVSVALPKAAAPVLIEVTLSNGCYLRFPSTIDTQELTKITTTLVEKC